MFQSRTTLADRGPSVVRMLLFADRGLRVVKTLLFEDSKAVIYVWINGLVINYANCVLSKAEYAVKKHTNGYVENEPLNHDLIEKDAVDVIGVT